jgi:hypothetical protein
MRSNHLEYIALMLFALGIALTISASIIHLHYQEHPNPQYTPYPIPLLIVGTCITALGIPSYHRFRTNKKKEETKNELPPPPPSLPPPPP